MKVDNRGNSITVDTLHAHTHEGKAYSASLYNAALGAGAKLEMQFKIPAGKKMHLKEAKLYTTGSSAKLEARYEPTVTDGTTPLPIIPRRLSNPFTSALTAFSDPTVISAGTLFEEFSIGSGGNQVGGSEEGETEWLIEGGASGVDITLVFTNNAVGAEILSLKIIWYE